MRDFVVRGLHLEAHALEHVHHRAARFFSEIGGGEIEVAADVVRDRRPLRRQARA
jgi:hypothetical protein